MVARIISVWVRAFGQLAEFLEMLFRLLRPAQLPADLRKLQMRCCRYLVRIVNVYRLLTDSSSGALGERRVRMSRIGG